MPHTYHLSLTHVSDQRGNPVGDQVSDFDFMNHDDLSTIIERAVENGFVPNNDVNGFCVGLKLLTEVVMRNRELPAFETFWPHLGLFIRTIKETQSKEQV